MKPIALLGLVFATCLRAAEPSAAEAQVRQADIDFCAKAAKDGIYAAFSAYAAPDATLLGASPGKLQGQEAVKALYADIPPGITLSWAPMYASAAASGDLAYTWGSYRLEKQAKDSPPVVRTGHYVTIWKRQADGTWKFSLDTGEPDPPPEKK